MKQKKLQQENKEGKGKLVGAILRAVPLKYLVLIAAAVLIGIVGISAGIKFFTESKTTRLGFEDIGELSTQVAYCSQISLADKSRDLWGIEIPFTQSKYIYSYDVVIKAGIDFHEITWGVQETTKTIWVKLPETKVLSNEIDMNSFQVYHESESIFSPISLGEQNSSLLALKEEAQKTAIANGLLENARENAKTVITGFIGNAYDLTSYTVEFQ